MARPPFDETAVEAVMAERGLSLKWQLLVTKDPVMDEATMFRFRDVLEAIAEAGRRARGE